MEFSSNFMKLRKANKMSQEEVASKLNLSRQSVTKWENGETFPDIENLIALAELFSVTLDQLVKPESECMMRQQIDDAANSKNADFEDTLIDFLLRAGLQTYAGKGKQEENSCRPSSHDYKYKEGDYLYIDTYFGGNQFVGEEAVFYQGIPMWSMNYCGRTLSENFNGDFLGKALRARPKEMPYRGPLMFQSGDYVYHNQVMGTVEWFQGNEEIFWKDEKVYECMYHGGKIK